MIKSKKEKSGMIEIDLTGEEGNVFFLIGYAISLAKQLKIDPVDVHNQMTSMKIYSEMTSSDYENAIQVFEKYFGEYVILYR